MSAPIEPEARNGSRLTFSGPLPSAPEIEDAYLAAILGEEGEGRKRLLDAARPEWFQLPANEILFRAIRRVPRCDMVSLQQALIDSGKLDLAGGPSRLPMLFGEYCHPETALQVHAETLDRKWRARRVIAAAMRLGDAASDGNDDISELIADEVRALREVEGDGSMLPPVQLASEEMANLAARHPLPETVVEGLVHRGSKMMLGGGSKTFKTWSLIDLAISVATGSPFWDMQTAEGRVLYVNLEIQTPFFWRRVGRICEAREIETPSKLDAWNLRGFSAPAEAIIPRIIARVEESGYIMIILDPIYKILGDRDENKAGDIADLLNRLESLAVATNSAVVFGAHFAKGNASTKEVIDRVSGSGSFARDPDSIVMMTAHEQADAYTVETILRNLEPMPPFVVRRVHPLMVRDSGLDPKALRQEAGSAKKRKALIDDILGVLPSSGATKADWLALAMEEVGMGRSTFFNLVREAVDAKKVERSAIDRIYYRV